ncbi:DUF21 domain-containing protein [Dasania sp. GY-MA-18]|uniref:DUF21 domain-containing protein n=1 Tax=Dasania phycosphaerae TaxID=2950436 RepID=A0A9J6RP19_9GAMM|nr:MULTISPECIES: DUF21 domain-containing protein [Dasania]MCR8923333.1 DUF21 domain-containing protein [Dasania sp. GY-MA-18]MCZ0865765.1 DUF21 domain-containing protein [Dasania phycosphaerae]MCZ0869490.1 DUF21 domain-containing protein [Dasania phycosphaerae]
MNMLLSEGLVWLGIVFCISQSAMFSGLNLALLGVSRLRLEVEAQSGSPAALTILALRKNVNLLLATILWGNVAINVLLTLLSNSVMAGLTAFLFSSVLITFLGEIIPQAYFSRNAMRMGALLAPVLKFYQYLLYPVAKPCAIVLDQWLGKEGISYFREQDLHTVIAKHIESSSSDVSLLEGTGAINFLKIDDIAVSKMGELIDDKSIIHLPQAKGLPVFPEFNRQVKDGFLQAIAASGKKWVVITDEQGLPYSILNAHVFLRSILAELPMSAQEYCHQPIVVTDPQEQLGKVLSELKVSPEHQSDDVIDNDIILYWGEQRRIISGSDILGRLLKGIVRRDDINDKHLHPISL